MATRLADQPPRLAIVGASVRAAAQSATAAGFEVVTADLFADRDLAERSAASVTRIQDYPAELLLWIAKCEADVWLYTGALENHPDLIDQMAAIKPLWGNAGAALRRSRDHAFLREALSSAGLAFPAVCSNPDSVTLDGTWLAKTRCGSSGSGVWAIESASDLSRTIAEGAEIEQRLAHGTAASAVFSVLDIGCELLGVSQQVVGHALTGAGPFQYAGSLWPLAASPAIANQLHKLGNLLRNRFELRGLVGVDLWIDGDQVFVLEVNPRYTAAVEVLQHATGVSALARHAAAFGWQSQPQNTRPASDAAYGKLILFAKEGIDIDPAFSDWAIQQPDLVDIPHAGQRIESGQPVLTLLAAGDEPCVESLFAKRVAQVERRLYA